MGHSGKFFPIFWQNETSDEIDRVSTSDSSTPSEKNEFQDGKVEAILGQNDASDEIDRVSTFDNSASFGAN